MATPLATPSTDSALSRPSRASATSTTDYATLPHPNIDNLGESIEDTLMDLASYSIMTLMELDKLKEKQ